MYLKKMIKHLADLYIFTFNQIHAPPPPTPNKKKYIYMNVMETFSAVMFDTVYCF